MAFDLVPRRLLSFPTLPSIWDEDEDWLSMPSTHSTGLTISEDEKSIFVEAAVPGIDPNNINVTYQDGYVWIQGQTQDEEKDKQKKYYRRASQSFSYRVAVPGDVDPNADPEATYQHGMIKLAFKKSQQAQPKKIALKISDKGQKRVKTTGEGK